MLRNFADGNEPIMICYEKEMGIGVCTRGFKTTIPRLADELKLYKEWGTKTSKISALGLKIEKEINEAIPWSTHISQKRKLEINWLLKMHSSLIGMLIEKTSKEQQSDLKPIKGEIRKVRKELKAHAESLRSVWFEDTVKADKLVSELGQLREQVAGIAKKSEPGILKKIINIFHK